MRRRLPVILAAISLACSAALAGLLALSYWYPVAFYVSPPGSSHYVAASRGTLLVSMGTAAGPSGRTLSVGGWNAADSPADGLFSLGADSDNYGRHSRASAWMPLWVPVLLTSGLPAAWAWRRRKRGARVFEVGVAGSPDGKPGRPAARSGAVRSADGR